VKRWKVMSLATSVTTSATLECLFRHAFDNDDLDVSDPGVILLRGAAYALIAAATHLFFLSSERSIYELIEYRDMSRLSKFVFGAGLRRCKRVKNKKED
jgi:hypothetical protein